MPTASSSFTVPPEIAAAAQDGRRSGGWTRARCPYCNPDGRNHWDLAIGDRGWKCHRCGRKGSDLHGRGIELTVPKKDPQDEARRQAKIRETIDSSGFVREGCPVHLYLTRRHLKPLPLGWPTDLRRHNHQWHPDTRREYIAMIGVVRTIDGMAVAVHRTYLMSDGRRADDPSVSAEFRVEDAKRSLGPLLGGAVRLGHVDNVDTMGVGEGIESTYALMMKLQVPCWAGLSAEGLSAMKIPSHIKRVIIGPDLGDKERDGKRAGSNAAVRLRMRLLAEAKAAKRRIIIEFSTPPLRSGRTDWANWADYIATAG